MGTSTGDTMNETGIRLGVIATHPVHYFVPLYCELSSRVTACEVAYVDDAQLWAQGTFDAGFDRSVTWDAPLLDGYKWVDFKLQTGGSWIDIARQSFRLRSALRGWVQDFRPDVVVVPGWSPIYLGIVHELNRLRVPIVVRPEARVPVNQRSISALARHLVRRSVAKRASTAAVIGTAARDELRRLGVPEDCLFDSPYAVALAPEGSPTSGAVRDPIRTQWGCAAGDVVFLYVGKLAPYKRVDRLLVAFAKMSEGASGSRLVVVGDGPDATKLRELAESLGIRDRVAWVGFANQSELPHYYAASDVLVLFSEETWGLVVNEAMAFSLPCVVSVDTGASRDLIAPGLTGYRVNPEDAAESALKLERMLDDERRARMGVNAAQLVTFHSVSNAADGLVRAALAAAERSSRGK